MINDEYMEVLEKYTDSIKKYNDYTILTSKKKAELTLFTDWDTVNEDRRAKGLPKISNQSMKDAYIKQDELYCKLIELKNNYHVEVEYYRYVLEYYLTENLRLRLRLKEM